MDCSIENSLEHYISEGLLDMICKSNTLSISGPAWMKEDDGIEISIKSFSSKVLCSKHNTFLSPLDNEMIRFIRHLSGRGELNGTINIDGCKIEQWFLKLYSGFLASGSAHSCLKNLSASKPTLNILFGISKLAHNCGLYFISGNHKDDKNSLALLPIKGPIDNSVAGVFFMISGFPFLFLFIPPWVELLNNISPFIMEYRPKLINIRQNGNERDVRTNWVNGPVVEIDISGPF